MKACCTSALILALAALPVLASAQVSSEKTLYYAALGDNVAAGEGAMPVTNGYVYRLYAQGVFASKKATDFNDIALRGARSWELRSQVSQLLCVSPKPDVVTITAGANDFLGDDPDIPAVAGRVVDAMYLLLNNDNPAVVDPIRDPVTDEACPAPANLTILVSNYYAMPHPDPAINATLDEALRSFDQALRFLVATVPVPAGSRIVFVDLYTPSVGRQGLVTIDSPPGDTSTLEFDIHPTNLGHAFIARQFELAWTSLQ